MRGLLTIAALALALSAQTSAGEAIRVGDVRIVDAWAKTSHDLSKKQRRLHVPRNGGRSAGSPSGRRDGCCRDVELRTYWLEGCFAHRPRVEAIELSPGAPTVLDPGGLHIMFSGLQRKLVEGETIALSLSFERAGAIEIEVPVHEQAPRRSYGHVQHVRTMID